MVRSCNSCSKTRRSFSSITLLVFHGMRLFYTQLPKFCSVRDAPGPFCQGCARSVPGCWVPPSPLFSQVLILKAVKVLCFDTLLQVLILNGLLAWRFASLDLYLKNLDRETVTARQILERVRKVPMAESMEARCAQVQRLGGAGLARRLRRRGWGANFM